MKTLSSLLILVLSMLFIVKSVNSIDNLQAKSSVIVKEYKEPFIISTKKKEVELLKLEVGITLSEIKQNI